MRVELSLAYPYLKQTDVCGKTVIMIDALRASATILTALDRGCRNVIPVETLGQALPYASRENVMTIGERFGEKVMGFNLPNSPVFLSQLNLRGKTAVMTTSNGTKAIHKARKAECLLIGSFLNASHCMQEALEERRDMLFVCAGRKGDFALEDGLAAGCMIRLLQEQGAKITCSDLALFAMLQYEQHSEHVEEIIRRGGTARMLAATGQEEDIGFCLRKDVFAFTGVYTEDGIVKTAETDSEQTH